MFMRRRRNESQWQPWRSRDIGKRIDIRSRTRVRPAPEVLEDRVVLNLGGLQTFPGGITPNGNGFGPNAVAVGDFNGDGQPDVVVANGRSGISVMLNNGSGGFLPAQNFGSGNFDMSEVAVGDFDGDGKLDRSPTSSPGSRGAR